MSIPTSTQCKDTIVSRRLGGISATAAGSARSDSAQNVLYKDSINAAGAGCSNIITEHERRHFVGFVPPNSTDYANAKIGDIYDEFKADSAESSQPHDFVRWVYTEAGWEKVTKRLRIRYGQYYGDATTRYDVTNPSGSVMRYTWDTTGTDPNFLTNNLQVGDKVVIAGAFAAANQGTFAVIARTDEYIEVINASGSAEADVVTGAADAVKSYETLEIENDDLFLANYTVAKTITLPTAVGCDGRVIMVKSIGAGIITVDGNASETVEGSATVLLNEANAFVVIISDGANWRIIGSNESSIAVGVSSTVATKTSDYTTTYADDTVIANKGSAITITLGTAACVSGKTQRIKSIGAGACTVATEGAQTIDGNASIVIEKYQGVTVQSDGTNWHLVSDDQAFTRLRTASGITTGMVAVKKIATAQLEALLDTSINNLFAVKAGDMVLCMKLWVQTAAGGAGTLTCGPDAVARTAGADADGILKAADMNAAGVFSSDDVAATFMGDLQKFGSFVADADGYITITSSSDQHASAFVGELVMYYIPATEQR